VSANGGAVGSGAVAQNGFSGGFNAKAVNISDEPINAIQLGGGTNPTALTLQLYNHQLLDASGNIPAARLNVIRRPTETPIVGTTHTFTTANEGQIVASQSGSPTVFTIPLNSAQPFVIGAIVGIERQGGGTLAITATAGVTLNGVDGASKSVTAQWGPAAIRKTGTNSWIVIGAIS
jgi:hypothetical protein